MYKIITTLALCLFFLLPAEAQTFEIDPGHSSVTSSVQRFGAVNVIGRFKDISGIITYDTSAVSNTTAKVVIQVDSYDANNIGGEAAVKSEAFLNAAQFPTIEFETTEIMNSEGKLNAKGNLTIHGVTKEIEFPFQVIGPVLDMPTQKPSIAIVAKLKIDRQEFGVSFGRKMPNGEPLIGNEVKIELNVLAVQK